MKILKVPSYFQGYLDLVPESKIKKSLKNNMAFMLDKLNSEELILNYAYDEGKWTLAQSIIHLIDTENIFAFRALSIARGEQSSLNSFDHNAYADHDFSQISHKKISKYYKFTRKNTLALMNLMDSESMLRIGNVSDYQIDPKSLFHMIAGHEQHHINLWLAKYNLGADKN